MDFFIKNFDTIMVTVLVSAFLIAVFFIVEMKWKEWKDKTLEKKKRGNHAPFHTIKPNRSLA